MRQNLYRRSLMILMALLALPAVAGEPEAVLPPLVILDANNEVLGPVVGFYDSDTPIVRIKDPVNQVWVFLYVEGVDRLESETILTYFSGDGCTGTAYHGFWGGLVDGITGYVHSVAVTGGSQWLFTSSLSETPSSLESFSRYNHWSDGCEDLGVGKDEDVADARTAEPVLDLDTAHPPDYRLP